MMHVLLYNSYTSHHAEALRYKAYFKTLLGEETFFNADKQVIMTPLDVIMYKENIHGPFVITVYPWMLLCTQTYNHDLSVKSVYPEMLLCTSK